MINAFQLAASGARAAARCGDLSYLALVRYFDIETPGVRETVINVFSCLFGRNGWGPPEFTERGYEMEIWYGRSHGELALNKKFCDNFDEKGHFTQFFDGLRVAWVVLFPQAFYTIG